MSSDNCDECSCETASAVMRMLLQSEGAEVKLWSCSQELRRASSLGHQETLLVPLRGSDMSPGCLQGEGLWACHTGGVGADLWLQNGNQVIHQHY